MESELLHCEGDVTIGLFEVGTGHLGIDVAQIREIVRFEAPTPLPNAPELIEGVVDLRGAMIPVVDLGRALDVGAVKETDRARIVLTEVDEMIVGFSVDAAVEVLAVRASEIVAPPSIALQSGYETMRALVRREDEPPVLVVSLEALIEKIHRSVLPYTEQAK